MTEKTESVVEQLADDAVESFEFPQGAPELKPLLAIRPRSKRAEFKRRYAEVAEAMGTQRKAEAEVRKLKKDSDARQVAELNMWAGMDDLYQVIDDMLRLAAVDEAAYNAWSDSVSDDDLMQTFNAYQQRSQPGEASSSTS